jgi:hypothetical protein
VEVKNPAPNNSKHPGHSYGTLRYVELSYVTLRYGQSDTSRNLAHIVSYIRIFKGVQLNSRFQHSGT